MAKDQVLWKNKWVEVRLADDWYTYVHTSDGVSVLGYRTNGMSSLENYEFLLRKEHTPCHGEGLRLTSLTGMIDEGYNALQTAKKELLEESGYVAEESEFKFHGTVFPLKSSDCRTHLFSVCLDGKEPGEIKGDGTIGEQGASVIWTDIYAASGIDAPTVPAIIMRMLLDILKQS